MHVLESESLLLHRNKERRQPVFPSAEEVTVKAKFPSYLLSSLLSYSPARWTN